MLSTEFPLTINHKQLTPPCPVFGECGGCLYQNISYQDELKIKEDQLKNSFIEQFSLSDEIFEPIIASPEPYHYRHRLDLKLQRLKDGRVLIGFSPIERKGIVPIDQCFIARREISHFIPELKKQAINRLTPKYRQANLTLRSGDECKVYWGGIGSGSLKQNESNYLWTIIRGKKIFYSLETFFQANLYILPKLIGCLENLSCLSPKTTLFDLYGGVGLFGINLHDKVKRVFLIEECPSSISLAKYNQQFHQLKNFEIIEGRVEDKLTELLNHDLSHNKVAIIDPPRAGLSQKVSELLAETQKLNSLIYLSCHPVSLIRDLKILTQQGHWQVNKIIPFDFFPRTKHLETLVLLNK